MAKNCSRRQPHSHLGPPQKGTPTNVRMHLIDLFPETKLIGLHFLSLTVWIYLYSNLCSGLQKTHLFCKSAFWPFKVVQVIKGRWFKCWFWYQSNYRKRVYDFLLVGHCDYGPIVHRFWDTATYWLKIAYFCYPSLIGRPRCLCSLWNFAVKLTMRKLESRGYPPVETAWS